MRLGAGVGLLRATDVAMAIATASGVSVDVSGTATWLGVFSGASLAWREGPGKAIPAASAVGVWVGDAGGGAGSGGAGGGGHMGLGVLDARGVATATVVDVLAVRVGTARVRLGVRLGENVGVLTLGVG